MIARILSIAILAAGLSTAAWGQGTSAPQGGRNSTSATATSDKVSGKAPHKAMPRHGKKKATHGGRASMRHDHGASTHDRAAMNHEYRASNDRDSPYRAALRRCVQGPEAQRDRCLDQAIAQRGR